MVLNESKIAVLITSHNRKEKTLRCLECLFQQEGLGSEFMLTVFLVDDGSTDGTSLAVGIGYPFVNIIQGDGNLYWNRGMLLAWKTAVDTNDFDYYLWLNDDTYIFNDAIIGMLSSVKFKNNRAIICGCTQSIENEKITYGGRAKKFLIEPNGSLQSCDLMNGNFVLIPKVVFEKIGMLDPTFHHGLGDYDYGLRSKKFGFELVVSPTFIGYCEENLTLNVCFDNNKSLFLRLKHLYSPLGVNPFVFFIYDKRHFGFKSAVTHFLSIHVHVLFPRLWMNY
jgi:GT2 family glycosyltransferase